MEINKITKGKKKEIKNPEGSIVKNRIPEIQLYLDSSNFNKKNTYYEKAEDKFFRIFEDAKKLDKIYVYGLSLFLADNGLKTSPVILTSALSNNCFSFNIEGLRDAKFIFNTPQRIAEALSLNKKYSLNNSFKKNILKKSLENMNEFTLKKNQLKRRKIKTKDIIKYLRPKPKNENLSKLYKDIIEDKAKFEDVSFVRKKSEKVSDEEKVKYLKENIDKIPINELIRNLRFIVDNTDFNDNIELQIKVMNRLKSFEDFRFLNIFDIIEVMMSVPQLEKMLFEVLKNFVKKTKEKFSTLNNATFLFDMSYSMSGQGLRNGFKYLVLLANLFDNPNLRFFHGMLLDKDGKEPIELIKKGKISEAWKHFYPENGTALLDSVEALLNEQEVENLIVISDEVSWIEGEDLRNHISDLDNYLERKNIKTILINPVIYRGTTFSKNIMAFSSLTSSIIYNISLWISPQEFIQNIKEYGKIKNEKKQ